MQKRLKGDEHDKCSCVITELGLGTTRVYKRKLTTNASCIYLLSAAQVRRLAL